MWKNQLRTNTVPTMRTNLKKPPVKPPKTNCYDELKSHTQLLQNKLKELKSIHYPVDNLIKDNVYDMMREINEYHTEEFYCKVLNAIKNLEEDNIHNNPIKFEFKDKDYVVYHGISYEPHAGLSYYNYASLGIICKLAEPADSNLLLYFSLGFSTKTGYDYVPKPNWNTWKWF